MKIISLFSGAGGLVFSLYFRRIKNSTEYLQNEKKVVYCLQTAYKKDEDR